jgi:prepilin-type N-terminal cleavage/methylation domain-containing protein
VSEWPTKSTLMTARPARGSLAHARGFVLVELMAALVLLAVGVLSVFFLFGSSLRTRGQAEAETAAALFADGALSGLRAASEQAAATNGWDRFWVRFKSGEAALPVPAAEAWVDSALRIRAGAVFTNRYVNYSLRDGADTLRVDHVLRYRLDVGPDWVMAADGTATNAAAVTLRVWSGAEGDLDDSRALMVYTEFENAGAL